MNHDTFMYGLAIHHLEKGVMQMLEFKNVGKKFKNTEVLKNISMTIQDGEFVVFIGPSGCGKTTTLKMINRLIVPSQGKILLNGKDILKEDVIQLRRNMGYVIQQTGLFPHMNVQENIEVIAKLEHVDASARVQKTKELMDMVGLDFEEYAKRYPAELSGGQQQRVGVARAFALNPDIIVMDEPFSALDPITRSSLQDELLLIQENVKKTIVFVTHDMDEAIKIADRICIMNDGQVLQFDTPEEILKHPLNAFVSDFVGKNRIWESPELIKAEDIMLHHVFTTNPNVSLLRAYEYMRSSKVDTLMVIDRSRHLQGLVTAKMIRQNRDGNNLVVKDIMMQPPLVIYQDDSLVDVVKATKKAEFYNAPVLNDKNELVGLITRSSLVTTFSKQFEEEEGDGR